jgi:ATP-dependent DNA ligase
MVRRDPAGVRLLTRNGYDWTDRFPRIASAAETLRARSFLIDGEAVACDGDGLPVFDRLRYRRQDARVFLYAFDLLELNSRDMRREPLEVRKSAMAEVLRRGERRARAFNSTTIATICRWMLFSATPANSASKGVMSKRLSSLARLAETDEPERTRSEARGTVKPADFLIRLLTALGWL